MSKCTEVGAPRRLPHAFRLKSRSELTFADPPRVDEASNPQGSQTLKCSKMQCPLLRHPVAVNAAVFLQVPMVGLISRGRSALESSSETRGKSGHENSSFQDF